MWLNGTWVLPSLVKVSWVICMILSPSVTLKRRLGVPGGRETWREWLHGPSEVGLIYLCVHACEACVQAGVCEYRHTRVTQRTTSGIDRHLSPYMKHSLFCCSSVQSGTSQERSWLFLPSTFMPHFTQVWGIQSQTLTSLWTHLTHWAKQPLSCILL